MAMEHMLVLRHSSLIFTATKFYFSTGQEIFLSQSDLQCKAFTSIAKHAGSVQCLEVWMSTTRHSNDNFQNKTNFPTKIRMPGITFSNNT